MIEIRWDVFSRCNNTSVKSFVNEADVAGGLQDTPIPLMRGETVSVWSMALSASKWAMKQGKSSPSGL
jgi:hypothetical protein